MPKPRSSFDPMGDPRMVVYSPSGGKSIIFGDFLPKTPDEQALRHQRIARICTDIFLSLSPKKKKTLLESAAKD